MRDARYVRLISWTLHSGSEQVEWQNISVVVYFVYVIFHINFLNYFFIFFSLFCLTSQDFPQKLYGRDWRNSVTMHQNKKNDTYILESVCVMLFFTMNP